MKKGLVTLDVKQQHLFANRGLIRAASRVDTPPIHERPPGTNPAYIRSGPIPMTSPEQLNHSTDGDVFEAVPNMPEYTETQFRVRELDTKPKKPPQDSPQEQCPVPRFSYHHPLYSRRVVRLPVPSRTFVIQRPVKRKSTWTKLIVTVSLFAILLLAAGLLVVFLLGLYDDGSRTPAPADQDHLNPPEVATTFVGSLLMAGTDSSKQNHVTDTSSNQRQQEFSHWMESTVDQIIRESALSHAYIYCQCWPFRQEDIRYRVEFHMYFRGNNTAIDSTDRAIVSRYLERYLRQGLYALHMVYNGYLLDLDSFRVIQRPELRRS